MVPQQGMQMASGEFIIISQAHQNPSSQCTGSMTPTVAVHPGVGVGHTFLGRVALVHHEGVDIQRRMSGAHSAKVKWARRSCVGPARRE